MGSLIILMGPPGSGKGTHGAQLRKILKLPYFSTGDLFRKHIDANTPFGVLAKTYIDAGNLVPDELVFEMIFEKIEEGFSQNGLILDGFPRTLRQAEKLEQELPSAETLVLNFEAPDTVLLERILGRLVCKECLKPYHRLYAPPQKPFVCDDCSSELSLRGDDQREILEERLRVYRKNTLPLLRLYSEKGTLISIEASGKKEEILELVLEEISKKSLSLSR